MLNLKIQPNIHSLVSAETLSHTLRFSHGKTMAIHFHTQEPRRVLHVSQYIPLIHLAEKKGRKTSCHSKNLLGPQKFIQFYNGFNSSRVKF